MNLPQQQTFFDDVGEFHEKFGLPVSNGDLKTTRFWCLPMSDAEAKFRVQFLEEELQELRIALFKGDLPGQVDALADLVWVALGTAHYLGAPFNEAWAEVRRANMEKERKATDPDKPYRNIGTVIKPIGWRPPEIERILREHNARS